MEWGIEDRKNADAQLGRSFEFSLPKEWSRQEQIDYTTEYIQKTFVDKGMCADWSIHDKNDGNPHVHLLVTMRPFNPDHSWGSKEVKDWDFVRDTDGNIVVDESHPDWWQDKKIQTVMESVFRYLMKTEYRKSGQETENNGNGFWPMLPAGIIQRIVSYGEANGLGCVTGIYP